MNPTSQAVEARAQAAAPLQLSVVVPTFNERDSIAELVSRIAAHALSARGDLTPHLIRRARPGETCNTA